MSEPDPSFEAVLLHLKEHRGFDFTGYKRSSLRRRVSRRMAAVEVDGYTDYLDYVAVAFHDVSETYRLREELEHTNRQLETAYEELQSTNDELQSINDELHSRTGELDTANDFLEAILGSLRIGVTVLAPDLQVQVWNRTAEDLWGVRREEAVGQHFLNLDIGLPTEQLRPLIRGALSGDNEVREAALAAVNRRGRAIDVRVIGSPLRDGNNTTLGVILLMEQEETGRDGSG